MRRLFMAGAAFIDSDDACAYVVEPFDALSA